MFKNRWRWPILKWHHGEGTSKKEAGAMEYRDDKCPKGGKNPSTDKGRSDKVEEVNHSTKILLGAIKKAQEAMSEERKMKA